MKAITREETFNIIKNRGAFRVRLGTCVGKRPTRLRQRLRRGRRPLVAPERKRRRNTKRPIQRPDSDIQRSMLDVRRFLPAKLRSLRGAHESFGEKFGRRRSGALQRRHDYACHVSKLEGHASSCPKLTDLLKPFIFPTPTDN
jgi:hypothetical protein